LAAADAVKSSLVQSDIDKAMQDLLDAVAELEPVPAPVVVKGALNEIIAFAEGKSEADYKDGWSGLQAALTAAKAVQSDPDAKQDVVDGAIKALVDAIDKLVAADPLPETGVLDAAVASVAGLDSADYTAESWKPVADALTVADAAKSSGDQKRVDEAVTVLVRAIAGLVAKPAGSVNTETTTEVSKPVPSGKQVVVTKVKFGQSSVTLAKGKSFLLRPGVYFTKGTPTYATGVTYKSSNPKVARVDRYGQVKALKPGTARITATSKDKNVKGKSLSASYSVKVVKKVSKSKVKSVSLPRIPKTMKVGQVLWLTGSYTAGVQQVRVTYSSQVFRVATIDQAGRLIALNKGKEIVTVKAGGKTKKYTITVK
jgi:hypothetical protein